MTTLKLALCVLLVSSVAALGCGDGTEPSGTGGTMMFEPGPTCTAFCAKFVGECQAINRTEAQCRQGCEGDLAEERAVSDECGEAVEAVFLCATELDCDGVYAWRDRTPPDAYPCRDKVAAVDAERERDPDCAQIPQN